MSAYQYDRLDSARSEIRLFTIDSTGFHDIDISMSTYSLDHTPEYYAVSYVWGDPNRRSHVRINGSRFSVTRNLRAVIIFLRFLVQERGKVMHFWADAICIRQDDKYEKAQQIPLMGQIYGRAQEVLVWLGPVSKRADLAFELLDLWSSVEIEPGFDLTTFASSNPLVFDKEALQATRLIFEHEWWYRMWTYQEAILARSLTFMLGWRQFNMEYLLHPVNNWVNLVDSPAHYSIPISQYTMLLDLKTSKSRELHFHWLAHQRKDLYSSYFSDPNHFSFYSLLGILHHRRAAEDRDKIYAMLGVISDIGFQIVPDYDIPTSKVYTDVVTKYMDSSLSLFALSGIGIVSEEPLLDPVLPSWVPDFRTTSKWPRLCENMTWHLQLNSVFSITNDVLRIEGIEYDIVTIALMPSNVLRYEIETFVLLSLISDSSILPSLQVLFHTLRLNVPNQRGFLDEGISDEYFWRDATGFLWLLAKITRESPLLLSKLNLSDTSNTIEDYLYQSFGLTCPPRFLDLQPHQKEQLGLRWVAERAKNINHRTFFSTFKGYMGLGPEAMQPTDTLHFLSRCEFPVLLRRVGNGHVHVGTCFAYVPMAGKIQNHVKEGKYQIQTFVIA